MKKISLQRIILFFIGMYFLVSFWPLRLNFLNSYIPGQLIPLFFVALLSLFSIKKSYIKSRNIDVRIVTALLLYILFNTIIQGIFDLNSIEYRFSSLVATLFPFFLFYIFMSIDINEEFINVFTRYLFFGIVIYVAYYFESFLSRVFSIQFEPHFRVMGQRDALYLNFALLLVFFKNYHSNFFLKILGFFSAIFILSILIFSQARIGYVLLLTNILVLAFVYRKYFFPIFLPFIVLSIVTYVIYFKPAGTVYDLIETSDTSQIKYGIARFNTLINSILSFFSADYELNGSELIRLKIWDKIVESAMQSPLTLFFGSGELGVHTLNESFLLRDPRGVQYPMIWEIRTSESQIFDTLFRRGLIGLIFLFTILFRFYYLAKYLIQFDQKFKDIYLSFYIWFFSVGVGFFFLPFMRDRAFSIFFFIAYAILSSRAYIIRSHGK